MTEDRPNVVVIAVDTLRADHLSCNGYFRETDPTIAAIAEDGVTFEEYYGSGVATGPAFTSLVTGLKPIHTVYYDTPWNVPNGPQLDDNIPTMAEIFQTNGYRTAAVDNLVNFRTHMKQFVRGYEYHMNATRSPDWIHHHVTADTVNEYVLPWLDHHAREPFFLFVHYWDPHLPYNQPDSYRDVWSHDPGDRADLDVRWAGAGYEYVPGWGTVDGMVEGTDGDSDNSIDVYDGEIRYVDDRIGDVYDRLAEHGLLEDTVLAVLGDHGEQLGQHGMWGHGGLYEEVTHVPLVLRGPGLPAGESVRGFTEHADLLPTLLDLAGIETGPTFGGDARHTTPDGMDGRSLAELDGRSPRERVILETHTARAIRTAEWKYIRDFRSGAEELYHVAADPMERHDLAGERPEKTGELRSRLLEWVADRTAGGVDPMKRRFD
jgi:arylsulfatase A-like enzyme